MTQATLILLLGLNIYPGEIPLVEKGLNLAARGEWTQAIFFLEKGLPEATDPGLAAWSLAHCHLDFYFSKPRGHFDIHLARAAEIFQWLTGEGDPRAPLAWYWFGVCQAQRVRLGNHSLLESAINALENATALLPHNSLEFQSARKTQLFCVFFKAQLREQKEKGQPQGEGNSGNQNGKSGELSKDKEGKADKGHKGEKAKGEGKEKGNLFAPGQGNLELSFKLGQGEYSKEDALKRIKDGAEKIRKQTGKAP